ncbi:MAG: carbohydrate ABC transporter permease [Firmicutes bacterium]|nr:carbohydrate ABC transporter permease [Bacillota bacterium]
MNTKSTKGEVIGRIIIYFILGFLAFITLYPFWHVIMYSISNSRAAMEGGLFFYPRQPTLSAYILLAKNKLIFTTYKNSIIRTFVGTMVNLIMTASIAYPLSIKRFVGRNFWTMVIFFTMLFSGGMIPTFLLVKELRLLNSMWSLILPGAISAYNMFIMRNFFQALPPSLEESANIDGATPFRTLVSIIVPLSKPVFAAMAMFYGIAHWNAYIDCVIYIDDPAKQVLQVYLRSMINFSAFGQLGQAEDRAIAGSGMSEETMKMAAISASVIPVLIVYPWLQKYYVKGVLIGSIKG